jgi:ATP/maltotriose-dependent transcriptional regulator MalT
LTVALYHGPKSVDEMEEFAHALLRNAKGSPGLLISARILRTYVKSARGDHDGARQDADLTISMLRELGQTHRVFAALSARARIERCAGELERAVEFLRTSCDGLEAAGDTNILSTFSGLLGYMLAELGQFEEAEQRAAVGRKLAATDDIASQALWRLVYALVRAHEGADSEAEALAREGCSLLAETDMVESQAHGQLTLAAVLERSGRIPEAAAAAAAALELWERKGVLPYVHETRAIVVRLTAERTH